MPSLHLLIGISIHALREEGDPSQSTLMASSANFYPRPPRGGRPLDPLTEIAFQLFLSTPSARRATQGRPGEAAELCISIHALREEGDLLTVPPTSIKEVFLSTPSARRATTDTAFIEVDYLFLSTPSARRATAYGTARTAITGYFYPRPPRGGRLFDGTALPATITISIHALREEGDTSDMTDKVTVTAFLSTPSARRATTDGILHGTGREISIHALREEGD